MSKLLFRLPTMCVILSCTSLAGSAPVEQDLLTKIQSANQALYTDLHSFICDERIQRFSGSLAGSQGRQIDTVIAKVAFEKGQEHYTDIFRNKKKLTQISHLSGAWSQGEYGTLLQQTKDLLARKRIEFRQNTVINGTAASIYSFDVNEQESPWQLIVHSQSYNVPFRTYVWISNANAQILKIARVSTGLPLETRVREVNWYITLEPTEMSGQTFLVPKTGQYAVLYTLGAECDWNAITFSNYHRFGVETTLRFDGM
ncbi:MAG: hypothetical protein WA324_27485 [Bryobacteraceae bacterium]